MTHSLASAFFLLLMVLDPFGSLPIFLSVMRTVSPARRVLVALRETCIAFAVLLAFLFAGQGFLRLMHLSERSLEVAGGVILFMVAVRMIFVSGRKVFAVDDDLGGAEREPFVFPLAVPLLAGPSAMATVLLLASRQPTQMLDWVGALTAAMLVCAVVLLFCQRLHAWLGDQVVSALEKLMGLVLTAVAVEMILGGLKRYFFSA